MNFLISMIMLIFWGSFGAERVDILAAAVAFAFFYILELYINKKFEATNMLKDMLNKQFGNISNEK